MKCFENACFGPSLSSDFLCCLSKHVFTVNMMNVGLQNFWVLDKLHSSLCFAVSSFNSPPNGFVIQLAMWSCDGKRKLNHWRCFLCVVGPRVGSNVLLEIKFHLNENCRRTLLRFFFLFPVSQFKFSTLILQQNVVFGLDDD